MQSMKLLGQFVFVMVIGASLVLLGGIFCSLTYCMPSLATWKIFVRYPSLKHNQYYVFPLITGLMLLICLASWFLCFPFYRTQAVIHPGAGIIFFICSTVMTMVAGIANYRLLYHNAKPFSTYTPLPALFHG